MSEAAPGRRILAVDPGERRIGVALSDELGILASPLCILQPHARDRAQAVARLAREHDVAEILVGYPRTLSGEIGPQARRAERFAEALRAAVDVPVRLWDERYSTAEAMDRLAARPRRSAGRRGTSAGHVDALAAAVILQEYLDSRRSSRSSSPSSPSS